LVDEANPEDGRTFGRGLASLIIASLGDRLIELDQTETEELLESSVRFWTSIARAKIAAGLDEGSAELWEHACRAAFRERFVEHMEYLRAAAEFLAIDPTNAAKN
jgi:hypothetical protein